MEEAKGCGQLTLRKSSGRDETQLTGRHVPHHSSVREGSEGSECLLEDLVVDLGREVSNEDVEVTLGVLMRRKVAGRGRISPRDANEAARRAEARRTSLFCCPW